MAHVARMNFMNRLRECKTELMIQAMKDGYAPTRE